MEATLAQTDSLLYDIQDVIGEINSSASAFAFIISETSITSGVSVPSVSIPSVSVSISSVSVCSSPLAAGELLPHRKTRPQRYLGGR
ncbi:hypothetical protein DSO57_1032867 [Entomophthora muscae]|uniref:Uncharacterized protein n=1 Tax=Entomophthora muscae TaxID=34485 RepID=A0ACC2TY51_9FUNG|nr:hypothetical protein DSO57_1032867 [Entomophthora muscae]